MMTLISKNSAQTFSAVPEGERCPVAISCAVVTMKRGKLRGKRATILHLSVTEEGRESAVVKPLVRL